MQELVVVPGPVCHFGLALVVGVELTQCEVVLNITILAALPARVGSVDSCIDCIEGR